MPSRFNPAKAGPLEGLHSEDAKYAKKSLG